MGGQRREGQGGREKGRVEEEGWREGGARKGGGRQVTEGTERGRKGERNGEVHWYRWRLVEKRKETKGRGEGWGAGRKGDR